MIDWPATRRRWYLIAVALAVAGLISRQALSSMLVAQGDAIGGSRSERAMALYRRALFLDEGNSVAADRIIVHAIVSHNALALREAVSLARQQLAIDPANLVIAMDRGLCLQLLHRYNAALMAFASLGERTHDPRALLFAADDAEKLHQRGEARRLVIAATRADASFVPAERARVRIARQW